MASVTGEPKQLQCTHECVGLFTYLEGILCEVPFLGGSDLLLFHSVGVMASCNYIPQIMSDNVL